MTFGSYDPVTANKTAPLDQSTTLTLTCTRGALARVAMDVGTHAVGTLRHLVTGTGAAGQILQYEIYKDSGRATIWGTGVQQFDPPAAPNVTARPFSIYGRVPQGQDVTAGAYTDQIIVTVTF